MEERTLYLTFDKETMIWDQGETPADTKRSQPGAIQQAILDYLEEVGEPQSPKQIAEQLGKSLRGVDSTLKKLVERKRLHKTNRGLYVPSSLLLQEDDTE